MARRLMSHSLAAVSLLPPAPARALLVLAVLAAAFVWGWTYPLTAIGEYLVVDDNPTRADALVVLSGDGGDRLEQGVDLYRRGYAPLLILTGGGEPGSLPAAEVMARKAVSEGVPPSALLLVSQSTSTREDAVYTRELMARRGLWSAILVTSSYHQRRASLTFARAFAGSGISVASFPVDDEQWRPDNWWKSGRTLRLTLTELAKLAIYKLNGYL